MPAEEAPQQFVPPHCGGPSSLVDYAANDLSWYANIPVPTSYMCMGSQEDFFGGYDHSAEAGIVHVANHHIAPGKKQWTWGNHEFGYAWDRNLTDATTWPYIELMAGVYTDNQPDFSLPRSPAKPRPGASTGIRFSRSGRRKPRMSMPRMSLDVAEGQAPVGVCVSPPSPIDGRIAAPRPSG